jgi:hypothetical protein
MVRCRWRQRRGLVLPLDVYAELVLPLDVYAEHAAGEEVQPLPVRGSMYGAAVMPSHCSPFYPDNERTASGRQPPNKGDGPDSNQVSAAPAAVCEREGALAVWPVRRRGEWNWADAPRPRPGDRGRSVAPGGPTPDTGRTRTNAAA